LKLKEDTVGKNILELGTGSGNIAIAVAKYSGAKVVASDISTEALTVAKRNAKLNQVDVEFIQSDMFEKIKGKYDLLMSNPPCSKTDDLDTLERGGELLVPRISCEGGEDGLRFHRIIIANSKDYLKERGILALQLCYDPKGVENLLVSDASFEKENLEYTVDSHGQKKTVMARRITDEKTLS